MNKDEEMMRALKQRRGPSRAVLFGGIGGVVVLVAVLAVVLGRGDEPANRAFSSLSRCMIGEPLADGENVFFRIREVELGEKLEKSAGDAAWPARCAVHATTLFRAIDGSGNTALLKRLLREQMSCGDSENEPCKFATTGQPLPKADETWKAAKLAGLGLIDVPEVAAPKTRLRPLLGKQWPSLGAGDLVLADHRFAKNGELWLLFRPGTESKAAVRWCRITPSGEKAKCADVSGVPRGIESLRLLTDDSTPALSGDYEAEGGEERGAFGLNDGKPLKTRIDLHRGAAIERRGDDLYLLEIDAGLVKSQEKLPAPKGSDAIVFAGYVGWLEIDKEGGRKLKLHKRGPGATFEKDEIELAGEVPLRTEPCETSEGGVLYGRTGDKQTAWFVGPGGWSAPVSGSLASGQRREWSAVCAPNRLTRNWVSTAGEKATLGSLDCAPQGCKTKTAEWKGGPVKQWLTVTELGASTLVLYETFNDDKRLKLGPLDKLSEAPPVMLMDAFDYSGPKFENPRIAIGPKLVVVVFDDEKELHALYVNADGKYGAVTP